MPIISCFLFSFKSIRFEANPIFAANLTGMLFNSLAFAVFLPIVFACYWSLQKYSLKWQNLLLMAASYFFYACWDWRFLFLLVFSTGLDYYTGLRVSASEKPSVRKLWFWLSIAVNLGFLGVFKYYNFFAESLSEAVGALGWKLGYVELNIILPVGISFYTFHGLSYVIDIYKNRIQPERNFIDYSLFVSYFPLLVAGPIERATHLLPQIKLKKRFDTALAIDGLRQIAWGLFKKVVIADSCAVYVNQIFESPEQMSPLTLVMGAIYFSFQIYGDFSGYSDIALGTSKLFGMHLLRNFNYPYFSRDIAEFWRRWHISLSSWFRDYLYIPLGGSRVSLALQVRNTFIIFLVSGFWHGANWTFIFWGLLNALFFLPLLFFGKNRQNTDTVASGKNWPSIKEFTQMVFTFTICTFAWIFFRAESMQSAWSYVKGMFRGNFTKIEYLSIDRYSIELSGFLLLFVIWEWTAREKEHPLKGKRANLWLGVVILCLLVLGVYDRATDFIYFQF